MASPRTEPSRDALVEIVTDRSPDLAFPVACLAALLCMFTFLGVIVHSPDGGWVALAIGPVVLVIAGSSALRRHLRRRRAANELVQELLNGTDLPLSQLLRPSGPYGRLPSALLREVLLKAGVTGLGLRVDSASALRPPIESITVPFEPVPLDEAERPFLEIASCSKGGAHDWAISRRSLACFWRAGLFGSLVLLLWFSYQVWKDGVTGDLLAMLPLALVVWVPAFARFTSVRCFVFPGGLIQLRNGYVFRRQNGILLWHQSAKRLHMTDVRSGRVFVQQATQAEGDLALRAWLSPVPAPSEEMLEAFLAGRQ